MKSITKWYLKSCEVTENGNDVKTCPLVSVMAAMLVYQSGKMMKAY